MRVFKEYGVLGTFRLIRDVCLTKLCFRNLRIIRYPFYIRGKDCISFGKSFTSGVGLRVDAFPIAERKVCIEIGDYVQVNDYVHIAAIQSVKIGNNVLIASKVFISDHNHGVDFDLHECMIPAIKRPLSSKPVIIGDNVWIGESVCILPGVTIGNNSIIGAGSVVTKDVCSNSIYVGNPARLLKRCI